MHCKIVVAALFLLCFLSLKAQQTKTLEGQILDSLNQPVSGVTITLKNVQNPTDKKEVLTDSLGFFTYQVTDPSITLQATYQNTIFYNRDLQFTQDTFLVLHYNPNITDAQTLEAAVITATKKSTLEAKADRFVFTPNEDLKAGKSATELFNAVPMLQFQEMNKDGKPDLEIIGKDNTDIYINGKRTFIAKEILLTMLSGQNATDIDKIEIIRNPNASYDVRPGGAIVNIIMKKNNLKGLNGNARLGSFKNSFTNYAGSVNLNYNLYNLNIQGLAYGGNTRNRYFGNYDNSFLSLNNYLQKTTISNPNKDNYYGGFDFNISYEMSPTQTLQISNDFYYNRNKDFLINTNDFNINKVHTDSNFLVRSDDISTTINNQTTLSYTFISDKKGSKWEAFLNYFFYQEKTRNITDIRKGIGNNTPDIFSENFLQEVPRTIHSFYLSAQYTHVFNTKHSLQGGFKAYYTYTDNPVIFHRKSEENKTYAPYPQLSNHLVYHEPIYSVFLLHNGNWSNKFQSVIGIKLDNTYQIGHVAEGTQNSLQKNWLFVLPTLNLNYAINKNHNLNYAFNSSVDKPSISSLNPYRKIMSNNAFLEGNPFLLVARNYTQELSYTLFQKYTFIIGSQWVKNILQQLLTIEKGQLAYGFLQYNLPSMKKLSMTISATESFFKNRWQINGAFWGLYGWYNNDNIFFKFHTQGWAKGINLNNTIILNSLKNPNKWLVNIGYQQTFRSFAFYAYAQNGANLSFGLTKKYHNWTFNARVTDIFRTANNLIVSTIPELAHFIANQYYDARAFRLSVSYQFGNKKLKTQRQKNSGNENKSRIQ